MGYPDYTHDNRNEKPVFEELDRNVRIGLDNLSGALERNKEILHKLFERLGPVLRPEQDMQDRVSAPTKGNVSAIASELESFRNDIDYTSNEIAAVLDRLDI